MGKDLKVKHSVPLPPTKYGGTFFIKKLCMGEQTFLGKGLAGCFTWEPMIRSFKVEVNGCKARVKLFFLSLNLTWVTDVLSEKLTSQIGD